MKKVLFALDGADIAPRFDLAQEALIVSIGKGGSVVERRDLVLARPSAEALCRVVTAESVQSVVCGGIEEEYLQYLEWKNIEVIHSVIGTAEDALNRLRKGGLKPRDILFEKRKR